MPNLTPLREVLDKMEKEKERAEHYAKLNVKLYLFLKRAEAEYEKKEGEKHKNDYVDLQKRYCVQMRGDL